MHSVVRKGENWVEKRVSKKVDLMADRMVSKKVVSTERNLVDLWDINLVDLWGAKTVVLLDKM
jgi:hypothetical protein